MRRAGLIGSVLPLMSLLFSFGLSSGCTSGDAVFNPKSDYPLDPWVKGFTDPDDCIGGEKLAARRFALPDYPKKAFKTGRQGWVILRLDIDAFGETENIRVERSLPDGMFDKNARRAAENWQFHPPAKPLENCRVLIRYQLGAVSLGG